ncbi:hypothetical protein Hanom_Chr15g01366131 [Helianthus anomalus]
MGCNGNQRSIIQNRSQQSLNNAIVCAVEKETFDKVKDDNVKKRFQAMKIRRGQIY